MTSSPAPARIKSFPAPAFRLLFNSFPIKVSFNAVPVSALFDASTNLIPDFALFKSFKLSIQPINSPVA